MRNTTANGVWQKKKILQEYLEDMNENGKLDEIQGCIIMQL